MPDLAPYACDTGILCETFDNAILGDDWSSLTTPTGTATIDTGESFESPSSLKIYAPSLQMGQTADPGVSHPFSVGTSSVSGVHIRELVYLSSQVTATVDLVRIASTKSYSALWLEATETGTGVQLTVQSTSGGSAQNVAAFPLDTWTCVEWELEYSPASGPMMPGVASAVSVNGMLGPVQMGISYPFASGEIPDTLVLGDDVSGAYSGATYWIDSLVMTDDGSTIGCP